MVEGSHSPTFDKLMNDEYKSRHVRRWVTRATCASVLVPLQHEVFATPMLQVACWVIQTCAWLRSEAMNILLMSNEFICSGQGNAQRSGRGILYCCWTSYTAADNMAMLQTPIWLQMHCQRMRRRGSIMIGCTGNTGCNTSYKAVLCSLKHCPGITPFVQNTSPMSSSTLLLLKARIS